MKFVLNMRSVAMEEETIEAKHREFIRIAKGLPAPWAPIETIGAPDPGSQLVAHLGVKKILGSPLRGDLVYQYRRAFRDSSSQDDYLWIEFDSKRVDFSLLVNEVVPVYIHAFRSYFLEITDDENLLARIPHQKEMKFNQRMHVDELAPVTFICDWLCERAFNLSCNELIKRLNGEVEHAVQLEGGVLVVVTSKLEPPGEVRELCRKATERLRDG